MNAMTYSDDMLSAYLDRELAPDEMTAVDAALARDPSLQARLDDLRRADDAVRNAYAGIANEPMPERVISMLTPHERIAVVAPGEVIPIFSVKRTTSASVWSGAIAASVALVAGLMIGVYGMGARNDLGAFAAWSDEIPASSPLSVALSEIASGESVSIGGGSGVRVLPILTFQAEDGAFCREFFASHGENGVHGVACGAKGNWRMEIAARTAERADKGDAYRTAFRSSDRLIDDFIDGAMSGEALGAETERALINQGW